MKRNSVHETVFSDRSREPRWQRPAKPSVLVIGGDKEYWIGKRPELSINRFGDLFLRNHRVTAEILGEVVHLHYFDVNTVFTGFNGSFTCHISLADYQRAMSILQPEVAA